MPGPDDPPSRTLNPHTRSGQSAARPRTDLPPPPSDPLEALAARLAEEMAEAWRQGERPSAEDYLARHPELNRCPAAAAQLIYEEVCLREQAGQDHATAEVLRRFPRWHAELEVLLECHRLFRAEGPAPLFPAAGETLGELRLLAELGRGARGRVFLAVQPSLADRLVVLKLIPRLAGHGGQEHLTLARLQHTYIVPLYWVQDFPARNLRALGMPYLGGATLDLLLSGLPSLSTQGRQAGSTQGRQAGSTQGRQAGWTGQDLLRALDAISNRRSQITNLSSPLRSAVGNRQSRRVAPARQLLSRLSGVEAVCWIGACLADALHHAHERGLAHLDIKPSNVLLAADGQPMLLDFHLAREPLQAHGPVPDWFGGTPVYMSPEQRLALEAVTEQRPVPVPVDSRSDIYSLGRLLYEALGGPSPRSPRWGEVGGEGGHLPPLAPGGGGVGGEEGSAAKVERARDGNQDPPLPALHRRNPRVSVGLSDVIHKCLAPDPARRYADAAALAADLRRHLQDLPLRGVPNRGLAERWRKWRRRRPLSVLRVGLLAALAAVLLAGAGGAWLSLGQRYRAAESDLAEGGRLLADGDPAAAVPVLSRGLETARGTAGADELARSLARRLRQAERAARARQLHLLMDQVRFRHDWNTAPPDELRLLESQCRVLWEARDLVRPVTPAGAEEGGTAAEEQEIRGDLLDLAIHRAALRVRVAGPEGAPEALRTALQTLAEAEALFGPSVVLAHQRQAWATALGDAALAREAARQAATLTPRTAWEHYALGQYYLQTGGPGRLIDASLEFRRALACQPGAFWPRFYQGVCLYRQRRYEEAAAAFGCCVAQAPDRGECFYNRALALAALGRTDEAVIDYDRAIEKAPRLAAAVLNRGLLYYREGRQADALADLRRALGLGADPATVHYNLALVHLARGERTEALDSLRLALQHNGSHAAARELRAGLRGGQGPD
jgi:serine/threonine protein kinase/Tfp pilus assembly protein PilF